MRIPFKQRTDDQRGTENEGPLVLRCSCATRCGSRERNEDNLRFGGLIEVLEPLGPFSAEASLWMEQTQVFCICDGIGGAARGELASRRALKAAARYLNRYGGKLESPEELAAETAEAAHSAVLEMYRKLGINGGCTLVMVVLSGRSYTLVNIGDSPAFYYSRASGRMEELTVCHNQGRLAELAGKPCAESDSNRLAYYLGKEGMMAADMLHMTSGVMDQGDGLVLCSDGVTDGIPLKKLRKYMKKRKKAEFLVRKAVRVSGADNCTAVCLYPQKLR